MADRVEIRQSRAARLYLIAFGVVWCSFLIPLVVITHSGESVIPIVMLAFGGTLIYRNFQLGVVADAAGLLVRNTYRTKRYAWAEVEDFRIGGQMGTPFGKGMYVLLRNGEVLRLDAATRGITFGPGRGRIDGYLAALRAWLPRTDL